MPALATALVVSPSVVPLWSRSYNLQSQLSALNYTNTPPKNEAGEAWTFNAAVNSNQVPQRLPACFRF